MIELVTNLITSLSGTVVDLLTTVSIFILDIAMWLHVDAPRLEGLVVGILLTWLMMRRKRHPLLRALSAPMKLIIDILDLVWDQVVDFTRSIWEVCKDWSTSPIKWAWGKTVTVYNKTMGLLRATIDRLGNKKE